MEHIIEYVVKSSGSSSNYFFSRSTTSKLFNRLYEMKLDTEEVSNRVRSIYINTHIDFIKSIKSKYVLLYILDYLIEYKLPDLKRLEDVYSIEVDRYLLIEDLIIHTPINLRRIDLHKQAILSAAYLGNYLPDRPNLLYVNKQYIVSLLERYNFDAENVLIVWEAQGICKVSNGLIRFIVDVFKVLSRPPYLMVNYLLKWNRNERLKGINLI